MTIVIRPAADTDADAITAIRAAAVPYLVGSAAAVRARLHDELSAGWWVALVDGHQVGFASCRHPHEGRSGTTGVAPPDHPRRAAGTALLDAAATTARQLGAEHLGAVADGKPGRAFAAARGFEVGREHRFARAEIAVAPPPP